MDKIEVVRSEVVEPGKEINSLPAPTTKRVVLKRKGHFAPCPHPPGVYFIRAGDKIKIGFSARPLIRLVNLQTSCPDKMQILGTMPGSKDLEAKLHRGFAAHHVRGEWFQAHSSILKFIARNTVIGRAAARSPRAVASIRPIATPLPVDPALPALMTTLARRRPHLPEAAKGHASNLIEQIRNFIRVGEEQRKVLQPHMAMSMALLAQHS